MAKPSSSPVFSVVIPLYNRANVIETTLRSVLNQSFQDFEIIVVDDGSKDDPEPVIAAIGDPRIRYIRQDNGGGSKARNTGIDAARGAFVAFLDSDDTWLPHHLEHALPHLSSQPSVCTFSQIIVDRGDGVTFLKPPRGPLPNEDFGAYLLCDRGFIPTIGLCIPAALARQVKYTPGLAYGDDKDFAIRLQAAGGTFIFLQPATARWEDSARGDRLSNHTSLLQRAAWIESLKPLISAKAYHGARGWTLAQAHRQTGSLFRALDLYANALMRGCYRPKMAVVIFLQVFITRAHYRKMSDILAALGVKP